MHPESHASASPRKPNADSMKHVKEEMTVKAEKSFRDHCFFSSLEPIVQFRDSMLSVKKLSIDYRKAFLTCCLNFLNSANNDSFEAAPPKVMHIVRSFVQSDFISMPETRAIVLPLRRCLERIVADRHAITALHAVFVQLCVSLDMYDVALPLVSSPIYDIHSTFLPTSLEYLSFHYFSGLVYAAFKRFDKALSSFDLAIGAISVQISAIQIAAYKKRVLIDIIVNGSHTPLTKLISPIVVKNIETLSAPYHQFTVSAALGHQSLETSFREHQGQLLQDGNIGLAKQALSSIQKMQIAKLAGSYMTLSLFEIAKMIGIENLASVEDIVLCMIEEGSINATIDQSRQMLTFFDDSGTFADQESLDKLFEQLQEISAAHDRVLAKNIALATDNRFLSKSVESHSNPEAGMFSTSEMPFSDMHQLFG